MPKCQLCGKLGTPYRSDGAMVAPQGSQLCGNCVNRAMGRPVRAWEYNAKALAWAEAPKKKEASHDNQGTHRYRRRRHRQG